MPKLVWATSRAGLGRQPPYVYLEFSRFLQGVADWIERRWHLSRIGLAALAIREALEVFPGVGAYTVSEILFRAGMPLSQYPTTQADSIVL